MDSDQLERWQLEKIGDQVGESLRYLTRLKHRMEKVGFPSKDPLFQRVAAARRRSGRAVTCPPNARK